MILVKKYLNEIINSKETQLSLLLYVFYISEGLTKIFRNLHTDFYNYSALIKGFFCVFAIVFATFHLDTFRKKILLFLLSMLGMFIAGQFSFNDYSFNESFYLNFIYFSRYLFVFILVLYFSDLSSKNFKRYSLKAFENIVVINSVLIILGVVFKIYLFQTYAPNRFGYNGLFMVPSISTYFYALAITYFSYRYIYERKKGKYLLLTTLMCFLIGTKALLLFLVFTGLHFFFIKKIYKKRMFYLLSTLIIINSYVFKDAILRFLHNNFEVFFRLYHKYDLITMLTSYRNLRLQENFLPLIREKWTVVNYLFGGTDFVKYRVEFELFDVVLFWGIVGSIIYLTMYYNFILGFNFLTSFGKVQIGFLLIIAMLSGTFFNNGPLALYLLIVLNSLRIKYSSKWL